MSLINDALKEARKASQPNKPNQPNPPGTLSPLQPVPERPRPSSWLLPAVVIFLLVTAIVLIGWAVWQRNHPNAVPGPATAAKTEAPATPAPAAPVMAVPTAPTALVAPVTTPLVAPMATNPVAQPATTVQPPVKPASPAVVTAPPTNAMSGPKLQGIFYSISAPSAIVDGKTVQVGDEVRQYHVKAISKNAVTLVGADKQEIQLKMER